MTTYAQRLNNLSSATNRNIIEPIDRKIVTPFKNKLNSNFETIRNKLNSDVELTVIGFVLNACAFMICQICDVNQNAIRYTGIGIAAGAPIAMAFTTCKYERGFILGVGLFPQIILGYQRYQRISDFKKSK